MKTAFTCLFVSIITFAAFAAEPATTNKVAKRPARRYMGGMIERPGTGRGVFTFINAQDAIPHEEFVALAKNLSKDTRVKVNAVQMSAAEALTAAGRKKSGGTMTVAIVNDKNDGDALVIAPESSWGRVNVANLAQGLPKSIWAKRARKEVLRAFGMLMGAVSSQYEGNLFDPVAKPSDLDACDDEQIPFDIQNKFVRYGTSFGIRPFQYCFYREACMAGWAPAPTNDIQKAVWDDVHSAPKNPIKIEFDPKKGR